MIRKTLDRTWNSAAWEIRESPTSTWDTLDEDRRGGGPGDDGA
jgi:hypothetical protein